MAFVGISPQTAIPPDTNESKTAYDLVRRLVLKGKLIVGDAAYCQREICEAVVDQGADYLVTVKGISRNCCTTSSKPS